MISGYKFEAGENVFTKFVNKYYNIKAGIEQSSMSKQTVKLALNGLFGRTSMKLIYYKTEIVPSSRALELQSTYEVLTQRHIGIDMEMVKYLVKLNKVALINNHTIGQTPASLDSKTMLIEQCLPVGIFTSAYSRIALMEGIRYLVDKGFEVYAVDTDSLHTNGHLPAEIVGEKIGQWKLEFVAREGVYPLPKLYYLNGHKVKDNGDAGAEKELKKSRGVKVGSLTRDDYLTLQSGKAITKIESRFVTNRTKNTISFNPQHKIVISPVFNKRRVVYKDGVIVDTRPILLLDKLINKKSIMIVKAEISVDNSAISALASSCKSTQDL